MSSLRVSSVLAMAALCAVIACDDDPNQPNDPLALRACPTGVVDPNAPLTLEFTTPLSAATVNATSIVVSNAATGVEVPGTVVLDPTSADSTRIIFTPSQSLGFSQDIRLRVQNLRSSHTNRQIEVTACEFSTTPPEITELYWDQLPNAQGTRLVGASLVAPDFGYAISFDVPIFKGQNRGEFELIQRSPYFSAGFDISFVSATRGFASFQEFRTSRHPVMETRNGGLTFDSVAVLPGRNPTRLVFRAVPGQTNPFGVVGGGSTTATTFLKYIPATNTFTQVFDFAGSNCNRLNLTCTGNVGDIDFSTNGSGAIATDTVNGVAVTQGNKTGVLVVLGDVYRTTNGGTTWTRATGLQADTSTVSYFGVARHTGGDIFIAGGNGYFARVPAAGGAPTQPLRADAKFAPIFASQAGGANDPNSYLRFLFTDVQFAPDKPNLGWVVGARTIGTVSGTGSVPRYQGLIFQTCDGGATWTRQGVREAEGFGADFPRLNRISVLSSTAVWIVGDGGTVLSYRPDQAACTTPS